MKEINNLNIQQKNAVDYKKGPLLIIAGAGTGKTTVITQKIKHFITDLNIPSSQILALTFTDKASFEMQERLDVILPYGYLDLWIHTFHSFCDRVLRDESYRIGLDPGYKLISETESILLLRQNIFEIGLNQFRPLGNPTKFLEGLLEHFSRLKDEDVTPDFYTSWAKKQKDPENKEQYIELATAYKRYEELKVQNSMMDFSDLISNTLLLFRNKHKILEKYQKQFRFILVDEFQDTNFAQNELAILLAGDDKNITVVADDDQSIYRFRGAAVSNVLQFKKNFPKAKIITLNQNYRSTQIILDSAYKLIQNNNPNRLEIVEGIDKKLRGNSDASQKNIKLIHESNTEDESDKIAKEIINLNKDYDYKDIAILVRANNHSQGIISALQRNKIPYQFLGPGYLFQQEEIKDLISYLTFLTNFSDTISLFRVLSMDIFGISYLELSLLLNYAKKKNMALFETLENLDLNFLKPDTIEKLKKFNEMAIKHLLKSKKEKAGQVLYYFLIDSGLFLELQKTDSVSDEKKVQNIAKFFERIKNFESERPESNIYSLVEWLTLMNQMGSSPAAAEVDASDRNAVNILTVHSSKGLEFDVVFLINLVNDRFPSRERSEKIPLPDQLLKEKTNGDIDFHLQEERRLFYVGMTRAKERLYFTAADFYGEGKRAKKLSQFISEANPDLVGKSDLKEKPYQLSLSEILSDYESETREETKEQYKVPYITYSNLQMFDICPLHYKLKVIYNLPTPISSAQSFGISLHNTLYKLFKQKEDAKIGLSTLNKILHDEWINEGYENKKHEQERLKQAENILKNFYKDEFNVNKKTLGLEIPFSFKLKNDVKVFGKIDRIDKTEHGIEIIDYKTGKDDPKAKKAHELQLAIYALAAIRVKDIMFNQKLENITLTLYFLEEGTKKSIIFEKDKFDKFEDELIEKISEIEESDFKCSGNLLCKNCEYKMLCNTIR